MTAAGDFDHVRFDAVTVDVGRSRILSRVSLTCRAGTITGLFGPNGAGKTTLLRLASGRLRPSRGAVVYGAAGRAATPAVRGRIGWLGHDPGLYPELSAAENLRFFAALYGVADVEAGVAAGLRRATLADRAADPVGGFSRGMRQRIGLERALVGAPRLVLLDEPFTGLDEASSRALVERLAELKAAGAIVILSTHDPGRIAPLIDVAVVLQSGRLAATLPGGPDLAPRLAVPALSPESDPESGSGSRPESYSGSGSGSRPESGPGSDSGSSPESSPEPGLRRFLEVAWLVARKDAVVELRSRELVVTTLFFAVVAILVFAFALVKDGEAPRDTPAGVLWVTLLFAGTLALGRAFDREQAHQTLVALLSAPVDRAAIYVGKVLGLVALLGLVLVVLVPLVAFLFQAPLWRLPGLFAATIAAGVAGIVSVGSLFAAMLVRTRSRDVLLPVLLYPMVVPVLLAGVRSTVSALEPVPDVAGATMWLSILVSYDAVFVTLALWLFDAVTGED